MPESDKGSFGVQKTNSKISVTNSEDSTNSRSGSVNQITDTSSNAMTTSSKISKTDDENEDEVVKIRVSDDYLLSAVDRNNLSSKYVYTNTNFSYAGSFSSISSGSKCSSNSSSSCKTTSSDVLKNLKQAKKSSDTETQSNNGNANSLDDRGLYSVKNASIRYENSSKEIIMSETNKFNVDLYSSPNNLYYVNTIPTKETNYIDKNSCLLKVDDSNEFKGVDSLNNIPSRVYRNESNIIKDFLNSDNCRNSNLNSNTLNVNNQSELAGKPSIYESYYLNNKNVILNPDDIIASIV